MENSITLNQKIGSHGAYWKRFIKNQLRFLKVFKNYWQIFPKILKNQYPIIAKTKNQELKIQSYNALYVISQISKLDGIEFNLNEDLVKIPSENKTLKIFGGLNNGDVIGCFVKNDYGKLKVSEKWVVDIGSNIGDSAIYFVTNGAKKVLGIEPFPKSYELATKNVKENNLQDKIEIIQAACAYKKKFTNRY